MLRCAELGLSDEALDTMTMGMIYDMVTEKANDNEKYAIKPAAGSMKDYFSGKMRYD